MDNYGYAGKILVIDLTSQEIKKLPLSESHVSKFLGGYGINLRLFWDYQEKLIEPFSPKNTIVIGAGPLVGTLAPSASKIVATTKSPIIASNKGLHFIDNAVAGTRRFGMMLKNAGYDHIVITGKAREPVYLQIFDDDVQIKPALTLWNQMDTYETTDFFIQMNPQCGVLTIGRAGEKLVRYALAIVDYSAHLGKFGFGAVMGSKNLKAIVTHGTKGIKVSQRKEFLRLVKGIREKVKSFPLLKPFHELGITSGWDLQAPLVYEGVLPYRTWKKKFGPKTWRKHKFRHNLACSACMLACRTDYHVSEGPYKGLTSFTGHHFLPARVALRLGIQESSEVIKLLDICNRAGLCFFTVGGIINWITRLFESDKLKLKTFREKSLQRVFSTYLELLNKIIKREDIGDLMSQGWYPLGQELKIDPDTFIEGTGLLKGADTIQDGRTTTLDPQRFIYLTNPRPHHGGSQSIYTIPKMTLDTLKDDASHLGLKDEEYSRIFIETPYYGKFNVARYAKHAEDAMAAHNSLGTCIVPTLVGTNVMNLEVLAPVYSALTGIDLPTRGLKQIGERNFTLYKILNIREGFNSRDICSNIWLTPRDTPDGPKPMMDYYRERILTKSDVEKLLSDYYYERGWDPKTSIPTPGKLEELGLLDFLK